MIKLDETDKKLLKLIQDKFPLVSRPYRHLAVALVIEESEVISRLERLKNEGVLRRIGPLFSPKSLGYKTILIAAKVAEEAIDDTADYINGFKNVTHNYLREGDYNIWFTFIYKEEAEVKTLIDELKERFNIKNILKLPAIKTYKLRTNF